MIDEMTMVMIARTSSVLSAPVDLSHVHIFLIKSRRGGERDRSMRLEGTSEAAALCTTKTSTHPMTIVEEILGSPQARLVTPWRWPVGSDAPERRHPPLAVTRVPPTQSTVAEKLGRDMDDIDDIAANPMASECAAPRDDCVGWAIRWVDAPPS